MFHERAKRIVLAQLHDRPGTMAGARIAQADRLHRPEAERLRPAGGDHLDRLAAVEVGRVVLPLLEFGLVAGQQRRDEGVVLVLGERAVEIVGAVAGRAALVVARLLPGDREIDALVVDDGRDGVEEGERFLAAQPADRLGQGR